MSLLLDERQRAMLAEMGIRVWGDLPQDEVDAAAASSAVPAALPAPQRAQAAPAGPTDSPVVLRSSELAPAPPVARAAPADPSREARTAAIEVMDWEALQDAVASCEACGLCKSRRNTVFGVGDRKADWLIVGEAPGENEDLQGEPFVGQAGKLLDNMLRALGLDRKREKVYIANVLKCRPPGNRNPEPAEVALCEPFLRRQVELLQPKIIIAMGRFAVHSLLNTDEAIGKLRGRRHAYMGVPLVVTYHPAYLLRNLPDKAKAWADLCLAMDVMKEVQG